MNCGKQDLFNVFWLLANLATPKPKYAIAALVHICVLGLIKCYTAFLAIVQLVIFIWISMPVISVKLNYQIQRWYKRINTEFTSDQVLRFISNAKLVQYGIAKSLKAIRFQPLLFDVHSYKLFSPFWIFVSASKGTVQRVVVYYSARGARKDGTARFAAKLNLVSGLPSVSTFCGAKPSPCLYTVSRYIKQFAADFAGDILPILPPGLRRIAVAFQRTVTPTCWHPLGDGCATRLTDNSSHLVLIHKYRFYHLETNCATGVF